MRDHILLFVNGQQYRVDGCDAFLTLSNFLRQRLKLCGTKIVCSEGDCGSCSVLVGCMAGATGCSDASVANQMQYRSIDSCIRFVFQLDGCHIVTVEGLGGAKRAADSLTGVQQAMVDCHGSQCGYCTPGFVVAMTGVLEENEQPTEDDWRCGLTGNLCRCTGYSSIIAAGIASNRDNTPPLNEIFPVAEMFAAIEPVVDDEIQIAASSGDGQDQTVYCPTTIAQATKFLAKHPDAKIVAGATDLGVQFNKGFCQSRVWLDLNRVAGLASLEVNEQTIVAGARATWAEFESLTESLAPQFHQIISVFGSPQIRHVGTIGGNIINASPIADSLPFLFICDAELEIASHAETRVVPINEFYQGYKKFDLQPGELLTGVRIPLPTAASELRLYKVTRRRDMDISTFTAAIKLELAGDTIKSAALAYGAVGPVVLRLPQTEEFLVGRQLSLETMREAGGIAVQEITPISDVRGGEDYRLQLARNVLLKFFHETRPAGVIA